MPDRSRAQRQRRADRHTALLRAYVAPEVVAHIMSDGESVLPSGVRLPVTVLFADIHNFTRLADRLPAERVVALLDEFFEAMTAAAVAHDATIDKLIGDAIMLVYGVPNARGDEAGRALATAASMHEAFRALLARWRHALPARLRLGLAVGCASGEAILANVGSAVRMDYTLIGAPVNLAARLTAAARSGETLVNGAIRDTVERTATGAVRFGRARHLALKGFRGRVASYPARFAPVIRASSTAAESDPVCGMKLVAARALRATHRGRTYHFCSRTCQNTFRRDPRRFAGSAG